MLTVAIYKVKPYLAHKTFKITQPLLYFQSKYLYFMFATFLNNNANRPIYTKLIVENIIMYEGISLATIHLSRYSSLLEIRNK